jgi:hypothetical protein
MHCTPSEMTQIATNYVGSNSTFHQSPEKYNFYNQVQPKYVLDPRSDNIYFKIKIKYFVLLNNSILCYEEQK